MADEVAKLPLTIKWSGKELALSVDADQCVLEIKDRLNVLTDVRTSRQKLLGLRTKQGKPATDETRCGDLLIRPGAKIMMIG